MTISLKDIGRELGLELTYQGGRLRTSPLVTETYYHQLAWRRSLSINSSFCQALVGAGYLTWQQMLDAVVRFRLGRCLGNAVIFWQINQEERICDGKVMFYAPDCHRRKEKQFDPTWVSALLLRRQGGKLANDITRHCFFGLHQLSEKLPSFSLPPTGEYHAPLIAIVESEKTAVILSAYYPQYIWLASGGLGEVQVEKFRPLRGRKIILFPDTDLEGKAYQHWYQAAQNVMAQPFWEDSPPIRVSAILEQHATPDQKRRKIDLADYVTENKNH